MSDGNRVAMHGRDHRKGGADPIPGIGHIDYPLTQLLPLEGPWYRGDEWSRLRTISALYNGHYPLLLNNYRETRFGGGTSDTRTAAIDDSFIWRFRLGPKNSLWGVIFTYETGPDHGRVKLQWASVPEDASADPDDKAGLDVSSLDFIGDAAIYEGYTAAAGLDWGGVFASMQLKGEDGDPFTTFLSGAGVDGGAGVYALKMSVYDKAGASSGYKAGITNLAVVRWDFIGGSAGKI